MLTSLLFIILLLPILKSYTSPLSTRRTFLKISPILLLTPLPSSASSTYTSPPLPLNKKGGDTFTYTIPLNGDSITSKPLPTHAYEAKFGITKKSSITITLDAVRIKTLSEFLSIEDLSKKLLNVELSRDGITAATLISSESDETSYRIKYKSEGKRGIKIIDDYVTIINGYLVVAQGEDKEGGGGEVGRVLDGFRVEGVL
ncbi:hypothetical protein TL16_g12629 [Triparma laevis f. inornata]|uniref:Uncharacterized protein n=2 Tax=Triparma laevis TaxID=1534972 RepID=A0A9W7KXJ9_9STRA|nr:hypothetical protein TL16_g12629 [Triparma laevis f. inornata]GMI14871.1 hypothetical protein TrLO_g7334 [Triparma laevis f. longispina]